MRSCDFFAVFCIESNIGPATRNKEKSHSNPSLNIAVKIWKCEWWAVGVVVAAVVWFDGGGASVSCGGRVFSHDDPLPKISPSLVFS